jgi:hypothetical protein
MRERLHAESALNTAFDHGVFPEGTTDTSFLQPVRKACNEDLERFRAWEEQLKAACRRENEGEGPSLFPNADGAAPVVRLVNDHPGVEVVQQNSGIIESGPVGGHHPKRDLLKSEQRRAHDIIETQLLKRMAGKLRIIPNMISDVPIGQERSHLNFECWFWVTEELGNQC